MAQPIETPFGTFIETSPGNFEFYNPPAPAAPVAAAPTRDRQPPFSDRPGQPGAAGDEAICGPRPGTQLQPGQVLVCNRQTRRWEVQGDPAAAYRPPSAVTRDEFTDPTRKPSGAPEGFDYVWNGQRWELQEVAQQGPTQSQRQSAMDVINALLSDYGLTGLSSFVYDMVFKEDVMNGREVLARIRADQGEAGQIYRKRFAGNYARRDAGLNVLSEDDYIAMETSFSRIMRAAGLPSGFYDSPDDFAALIGGDVSAAELSSRVNDGYLAVQQANPQVINEMRRLYGVDDSMLAAYFLDPAKATPMLLRQARSSDRR